MPVLIRHRSAQISPGLYDQISGPLLEGVKSQPGFILHVAFEDSQGFCVAELWETQEQHDTWFNANVAPNVPAEITQEVVEVHNIQQPA